ncbi:hypothetical protein [Crassaminicella indica]|uniref:Uncharacterized protein n=1 Tax=Crassaminicella indica TaxID=2855394 RepID=A0ABX8RBD3_9CLOT|nr:hypothetical protein [Crassaminicella indica]QXM06121.1 hypothetical protein KVH43_12330 [Crassaminicella indica]
MSIRPIDFQVLMPKTQQQSQENQVANNRVRLDQEYLVQQDKMNIEHKLKKVNEFENKDHPNIRDKQDNHQKGSKKNKGKKKENDTQVKNKKKNEVRAIKGIGANIDIKI